MYANLQSACQAYTAPDSRLCSYIARSLDADTGRRTYQRLRSAGFRPDVFTYTNLMIAYGREGKTHMLSELVAEMQTEGVAPNVMTHIVLVTAYAKKVRALCVCVCVLSARSSKRRKRRSGCLTCRPAAWARRTRASVAT